MTYLPEPHPNCRAARVRPAEITPAVLGFQDGGRTQGQLEVISLTGGLLSLSKPAVRGSHAQLMFVTDSGPVLGEAEMLSPVSWSLQPFRFVALEEDDQCRLRTAIYLSLKSVTSGLYTPQIESNPMTEREQEWIEKYRATLDRNSPRRQRWLSRTVLAAITLATLGLGSAIYVFSVHLR